MKKPSSSIAPVIIGNALEMYDFMLYSFFANIFAQRFFPHHDHFSGLIASYGIFAAGFISRPAGTWFLGRLGDLCGRKSSLELSLLIMLVPTALISVLPTYENIGIFAPLLLLLLRILQGFSVGGETVASFAYLYEHAPEKHAGYVVSIGTLGFFVGIGIASTVAFSLSSLLSNEHMLSWGWRLAHALGLIFALCGYLLRRRMPHDPISRVTHSEGIQPLRSAHTWKLIALIYGTVVAPTAGIYLIFNYLPVYMQTQLGLPMAVANCSNIAAVVTASVVVLWAGKLCDRYGRFRVVRWGALGHLMCAGPAFYFMSQGGGALTALLAQQIMAACTAVTYAPIGALCVELFSREIRQTAAGISYNAAVMSIGGLTPMMVTYLIRSTGSLQAPALWLSGAALVTIVVTAFAGTSEDVKLLEKRKRTDGSRIISAHESPTPGYTSPS